VLAVAVVALVAWWLVRRFQARRREETLAPRT